MQSEFRGLSPRQALVKRTFDLSGALIGLILSAPLIAVGWALAAVSTRSSGFFVQERVGKEGQIFKLIKLRTMRSEGNAESTVTFRGDPRVTPVGAWLRRFKIDELPQLWNVLRGQMSFVGPRPDVPGFADQLQGNDRLILTVRPGITGPATIKYRNEEELIARQSDPEQFNEEVLWPDKVRINKEYVADYRFQTDLLLILKTLLGRRRDP